MELTPWSTILWWNHNHHHILPRVSCHFTLRFTRKTSSVVIVVSSPECVSFVWWRFFHVSPYQCQYCLLSMTTTYKSVNTFFAHLKDEEHARNGCFGLQIKRFKTLPLLEGLSKETFKTTIEVATFELCNFSTIHSLILGSFESQEPQLSFSRQ